VGDTEGDGRVVDAFLAIGQTADVIIVEDDGVPFSSSSNRELFRSGTVECRIGLRPDVGVAAADGSGRFLKCFGGVAGGGKLGDRGARLFKELGSHPGRL
jgi:hypothetical protein